MARRVISRRTLRDERDQTARSEERESTNTDEPREPGTKARVRDPSVPKTLEAKAPPKPRVRKRAAKMPPRMFARWAVCDNAMKHLAVFEYKDRAGADDKLAEMLERKPGAYFLQLVKIPHNPPAEEAAAV